MICVHQTATIERNGPVQTTRVPEVGAQRVPLRVTARCADTDTPAG